jgi:hypothetical protein
MGVNAGNFLRSTGNEIGRMSGEREKYLQNKGSWLWIYITHDLHGCCLKIDLHPFQIVATLGDYSQYPARQF